MSLRWLTKRIDAVEEFMRLYEARDREGFLACANTGIVRDRTLAACFRNAAGRDDKSVRSHRALAKRCWRTVENEVHGWE